MITNCPYCGEELEGMSHECSAGKIAQLEERVRELEEEKERLQRDLYWSRMELQGQVVPWNGEFRFDHEHGLAWFLNKAELEALGGE